MLKKLKEKGEFTGENLFIDGTKIEADANRYTFVWKKRQKKYEKKLEGKIAGLLEELRQIPELEFDENADISEILVCIDKYVKEQGAFGVLKQDWSFRRFLMRRKNNVMTEWTLLCTAFDIRKYASKISRKLSGISLFPLNSS